MLTGRKGDQLGAGVMKLNFLAAGRLCKSVFIQGSGRSDSAAGAAVICGHDDQQWQSVRKGGDGYE